MFRENSDKKGGTKIYLGGNTGAQKQLTDLDVVIGELDKMKVFWQHLQKHVSPQTESDINQKELVLLKWFQVHLILSATDVYPAAIHSFQPEFLFVNEIIISCGKLYVNLHSFFLTIKRDM